METSYWKNVSFPQKPQKDFFITVKCLGLGECLNIEKQKLNSTIFKQMNQEQQSLKFEEYSNKTYKVTIHLVF